MASKLLFATTCASFFLFYYAGDAATVIDPFSRRRELKSILGNVAVRQGFTGEACSTDAECRDDRQCLIADDGVFSCPASRDSCLCFQKITCVSDSDCPLGEGCLSLTDSNLCASESLAGSAGKLNFEPCSQSSECAQPRECLVVSDGEVVPCDGEDDCACLQDEFSCRTTADCVEGETCQGVGTSFVCRKSDLPGAQLNVQRCLSTSDCVQPRLCLPFEEGNTCTSEGTCICLTESPQCTSSDMCHERETCQVLEDSSISICVASSLSSSQDPVSPPRIPIIIIGTEPQGPDRGCEDDADCAGGEQCLEDGEGNRECQDTSENVCISVHHLSHLHETDKLYASDRQARVFCDANSSCATPGHIVVHDGTPMMMSSYCKIVGCVQKIMKVNNPKYKRARLVESNSVNLMFTSFAARYNSRMEERMLRVAIRLGL